MCIFGLDIMEFVINNIASLVLTFISMYLALWVQARADEKKEREQYIDDLKSFQKELKKNQEKKFSGTFTNITQYEKYLDDGQELFDQLSYEASDADSAKDRGTWVQKLRTIYDEYSAEYQKANQATVDSLLEKVQSRKSLNLAFSYYKDTYRLYLANGIKVAQKLAKDDDLASEISHVYTHMEAMEKRVKEIEETFNKEFMPKYSGFMYEANEFMEKLLPILKEPEKIDEDKADEICDAGKSFQDKMEEVGEIFGILGNLQVFIEDIEESETELATMLNDLLAAVVKELKEFGVETA